MATRDELLSQCRAETRPGLLNPSPEHPALLKNINEYLLCRAAVEELRLEGEFPEVESDALELTVEAFDEFMGESMKSMGDLMNLVDEISRARSLNYVFPSLKVEGGSASTEKTCRQSFSDTAEVKLFGRCHGDGSHGPRDGCHDKDRVNIYM